MSKTTNRFFGIIFVLVALVGADQALADWTAPVSTAPACPLSEPACNVPINVGTAAQAKRGPLGVNSTTVPTGNALFVAGKTNIVSAAWNTPGLVAESAGGQLGTDVNYSFGTRAYSHALNSNNGYNVVLQSVGNNTIGLARSSWNSAIGALSAVIPGDQIFSFYSSGRDTAGKQIAATALEGRVDGTVAGGIVPQSFELGNRSLTVRPASNNANGLGQVGINLGLDTINANLSKKPHASLSLAVGGKVGATAYCDLNGQNCLTPAGLPAAPADTLWQKVTGTNTTIQNVNSNRVSISGSGSGEPVLRVRDATYGSGVLLATNGNGAEIFGSGGGSGLYAHTDSSTGVGIVAHAHPSSGSTESYGLKAVGVNIGSYTKGKIALYATDNGNATAQSNAGRDNRIPSALASGSAQYAGYFDGNVNINGSLTINGPVINNGATVNLTNYWTASGGNLYNNTGTRVGIGTSNPQAKLDVAGQVRIVDGNEGDNRLLVSDDSGFASWKEASDIPGLGGSNYWTLAGVNLYNNNGTNIGIGTSNPLAKLDIAGKVRVADGTQGANRVLVSDTIGVGSWKNPADVPGLTTKVAVRRADVTDGGSFALPTFADGTAAQYSQCVVSVNPRDVRFDDYASRDDTAKILRAYVNGSNTATSLSVVCRFEWENRNSASYFGSAAASCQVQALCAK